MTFFRNQIHKSALFMRVSLLYESNSVFISYASEIMIWKICWMWFFFIFRSCLTNSKIKMKVKSEPKEWRIVSKLNKFCAAIEFSLEFQNWYLKKTKMLSWNKPE